MNNTHTWHIVEMNRRLPDEMVTQLHWTCVSTCGMDSEMTTSSYGSVGLEIPEEGSPAIPFGDITESIAIDWLFASIDQQEVEERHNKHFQDCMEPEETTGLPW